MNNLDTNTTENNVKIYKLSSSLFRLDCSDKYGDFERKSSITAYNVKVYEYKNHIEIRMYEKPIWSGFNNKIKKIENNLNNEIAIKNRNDSIHRANEKFRRLINSNFDNDSKFLTLTFTENIQDIKRANRLFNLFIKRLKFKYCLENLQYIGMIQFQKRGAVHYHLLINIDFVDIKELLILWKYGKQIDIKDLKTANNGNPVTNVAAYIMGYMNRNMQDIRLKGQDLYLRSHNLKMPAENKYLENSIDEVLKKYNGFVQWVDSYPTKNNGLCIQIEINKMISDEPLINQSMLILNQAINNKWRLFRNAK